MSKCPHYEQNTLVDARDNCPHCVQWINAATNDATCFIHEKLKDVKQIWPPEKEVLGMEKYIGFKMIDAEPMTLGEYNILRGWQIPADEDPAREGYLVVYPDGYKSWSPKQAFDYAHMQVSENNTITQENVEKFIRSIDTYTIGNKTSMVVATLVNNYTITETSSCVDPANFNHEMGVKICVDKIKNQVWGLLGFLLQTAKDGVSVIQPQLPLDPIEDILEVVKNEE